MLELIYQHKYTLVILYVVGFLGAKSCYVPTHKTTKVNQRFRIPLSGPATCRRMIGKMIYLTNTRHMFCSATMILVHESPHNNSSQCNHSSPQIPEVFSKSRQHAAFHIHHSTQSLLR